MRRSHWATLNMRKVHVWGCQGCLREHTFAMRRERSYTRLPLPSCLRACSHPTYSLFVNYCLSAPPCLLVGSIGEVGSPLFVTREEFLILFPLPSVGLQPTSPLRWMGSFIHHLSLSSPRFSHFSFITNKKRTPRGRRWCLRVSIGLALEILLPRTFRGSR